MAHTDKQATRCSFFWGASLRICSAAMLKPLAAVLPFLCLSVAVAVSVPRPLDVASSTSVQTQPAATTHELRHLVEQSHVHEPEKKLLEKKNSVSWFLKTMHINQWVDSKLCFMFGWACPEPPKFIESIWGEVYFWMLVAANIFVVLLLVSVIGGLVSHLTDPMPRVLREQRAKLAQRPITVLLPCYLPNEHEIMWSTINHMVEQLEYEYPFRIICCYNTPKPMQIEEELEKLDGTVYPNGRSLQVLKVSDSLSKAENLNAALKLVTTEHVVIYDADHHPDPDSLLVAMASMVAHSASCIQGSTYLRSRPNMLAMYINAEFFVTHFVFFPAMQFITSMGVFGGSNALWKTDALRAYQFHADVQTEDIDLSTRALLSGTVTIRFEPRCRSGELPPATFRALYRQRLRWALGWDQVTLQHFSAIGTAPISCCAKVGLYYILPLRWGVLLSATLNALLTPMIATWYFHTTGGQMGRPIEGCIILSLSAFICCSLVVATHAVMYEPARRWPAVLLFQVSGLLYIGWQVLLVVVSLAKICTGTDGGWVVTKRVASPAANGKPAPISPGTLLGRGGFSPQPPSPIAAAFAVVDDADAKVPNSLGRSSPDFFRTSTWTKNSQARALQMA